MLGSGLVQGLGAAPNAEHIRSGVGEGDRGGTADEIVLTGVIAALSDPIRVGLVRVLADGQERGWGELRAPVAKSTLSHHLRVLRDAGLTRTRQEGTRCFVVLSQQDLQARFPGLLQVVLAAAEDEDVGRQVSVKDDPQGSS